MTAPTEHSGDVLAVEGLRKVYRVSEPGQRGHSDLVAVDDVSFRVPAAGSVGIVGESGSGKTTVARLVLGLQQATAGRIVVAGRERHGGRWFSGRERRRRGREVSIVFQDPYSSLDPRQRVGAAIEEVLRLHFDLSRDERARRVAELLDAVHLDQRHAGSLPRHLSGGQRQRVAIAKALAAEPLLLVLDEAVAALDVSIQAQVLNLLAEIRERSQVAYLFITHNFAAVRQVTDDVIVMRHGAIVERGPTGQILDEPSHPYTQLLRASVPGPGWAPRRALGRVAEVNAP
ncbi:ABC transporter ATP-binding protein [Capillimicrobium parvum]|uniref:Oligopeptide transport ATP-binding protein OppF n=1 Tax=Capillimicrobium parvum TaxID=2884022 RepID=A0A9E6Y1L4_9ACTN|nr:ATP-binding cassette domain-containing protein [Capillimicrobium parvum]UGS38435.1 Oligopeptide transport ATP-binding protein OppF [Capillimicrobium parvum]